MYIVIKGTASKSEHIFFAMTTDHHSAAMLISYVSCSEFNYTTQWNNEAVPAKLKSKQNVLTVYYPLQILQS